jgi:C1A family cysteine protease
MRHPHIPAAVAANLGADRLPERVDLREWTGPVHFQGGFDTCAAHVGACLVSYFEKRARGADVEVSRLFLYRMAKAFRRVDDKGHGVYIAQVMGVIKLLGAPPERYWPYPDPGTPAAPRFTDPLLDAEPSADCYEAASEYRTVNYQLEDVDQQPDELLRLAKAHLAAAIPFAFDFPLTRSVAKAQRTGRIPFPAAEEPILTNHAVAAVGYDDAMEIGAGVDGTVLTRGALLVKNSWSAQWGEGGYGWLPYEFVLRGRTRDFWTLLRAA